MHIPDGMLSTQVVAATGATSAGFVGYAVAWAKKHLDPRRIVLMAVMAALVFALQMLNFPVGIGTSGHFAGGAMAAIMLGAWPAVIVLTTVLLVQSFLFADGGVLALGANILNIAVIAPFLGYAIWRAGSALAPRPGGRAVAAFAAGWAAAVVAALAAGAEIWLSGRASLVVLAAMGGWHALIGIGEGLITAGLVSYVAALRPDLLDSSATEQGSRPLTSVVVSLTALALVAAALSFVAATNPDGLEFVAAQHGFLGEEQGAALLASPLPDYIVPGVANTALAGVLAALVGVAVTGMLLWGAAAALTRQRASEAAVTHAQAHADALGAHGHEHEGEVPHAHPHHHDAHDPEPPHAHPHAIGFERLTYVMSPVHELDPRAKVLATLLLVFGIVLSPPVHATEFVALAALLFAVTLIARIPIAPVLGRSALVLPVAGGIALLAPLAHVALPWSAESVSAAYAAYWPLSWGIVSKGWLAAYCVVLLAATTPAPRLFKGLAALGMPRIFLTMLSFLYRFTDVLGEQLGSLRRAVTSRAPSLSGRKLIALYGNLAGSMFIRAYERGERVHAAMLSRGYDGTLPDAETLAMRASDSLVLALAVLAVTAIVLY